MTPETLSILSYISIWVTIVGALIGAGFHLEKRANTRMKELEYKIEKDVLELQWSLIDEHKIQTPKEEKVLPDLREVAAKKFPLRKWN